jgi:hypothetical protein
MTSSLNADLELKNDGRGKGKEEELPFWRG